MELPIKDTPSLALIQRGYGGAVDVEAISDCMQLLRVAKVLLGFFYARFAEHDISPGKYSVLMELLAQEEDESLSPSILAERIGVTRPTITGLIDGLVRQGFVLRRNLEQDRRGVAISLSDAGREFMRSFLPGQFDAMAGVVSALSAGQRQALRDALTTLEGSLR